MALGSVTRCKKCERVQVAFGTSAISFTRLQFEGYAALIDDNYKELAGLTNWDEKLVGIATPACGVTTILTFRELCALRYLLLEGRKKLMQNELFSFCGN